MTENSTDDCMLAAAEAYIAQGWSPIPVPFRSKKPVLDEWQRLRLKADNVQEYFNGRPTNLGVLLGEPSGWLVDVDLDHPRCVELAAEYLPATPAIFGRAGKLRSHWVFQVTEPTATLQLKHKSTGMLVELRSTGAQTVFPPSVHECGEVIEWDDPAAVPALVDADVLREAVKRLADAVKIELGLKQAPKAKRTSKRAQPFVEATAAGPVVEGSRNVTLTSQGGKLRRLGMSEAEIETALQHINQVSCKPPLDSDEVSRIAASVASYAATDGEESPLDEDGYVGLGSRDPESGRLVISSKRTLPTAVAYLNELHRHPEATTLVAYAGQFQQWTHGCYRQTEDAALNQILQRWLHAALRYTYDKKTESLKLVDFESNPSTIKSALESIRARVYLASSQSVPFWRTTRAGQLPPTELLACKSMLVHLPTLQRLPATPAFFTLNALDFDYDPDAEIPFGWLTFLSQLFGDDIESIELLQEWFGYCLVADTSQQKMLLIVGPKRGGKGTIARILSRLVGIANVCGPTTSSLAGPFGLQPLLYKTLAIVSDARFQGDQILTVVERLLCISGEDTVTVDRKYLESLTLKLLTRFLFLSNELPRFTDSSGALASRFMILKLTNSFYGHEDHGLTERLLTELPGILNWAITGWQRLNQRGHFIQPASVAEAVQDMEDLSSPVKAFVRDCCVVRIGCRVYVDDLYHAWKQWCESEGRQAATNKQTFGKDLGAAVPLVVRRRDPAPFYEGIGLRENTR